MIFSSIQYFLFLPFVLLLYWRLQDKPRLILLVLASYFFYMCCLPVYGLLLFALSSVSWLIGMAIGKSGNRANAKALLTGGIVLNLACLVYYKYTNFILVNFFSSLAFLGNYFHIQSLANLNSPVMQIVLPLGISFFVFEFIHYLVDVYKGSKPVKSWLEFSAFAAFFPSQIAGPIKRYQDFESNLRNPAPLTLPLVYEGMTLICQGLFKKIAIADPLGWVIAPSFAAVQPISGIDAWIAFLGFSIQIFCDFSGYTDMGRGSALLMGIRLPVNFDLPYLAQDISSFWRRWHISLSTWIRDYIYIPIGGSRCSHFESMRNLFVTMTLCGLWHGAAWQFVAWGSLHGLALIANREWKKRLDRIESAEVQEFFQLGPLKAFNVLLTFLFVAACFVMFRAPNLQSTFNVLGSLLNFQLESNTIELLVRTGVLVFLPVYLIFFLATELAKKQAKLHEPWQLVYPIPLRLAAWTATALFVFAARPSQVTPFIYFQF